MTSLAFWTEHAPGVWTHCRRGSSGLPLTTVVIRGEGARLIIYSPTRGLDDAAHAELLSLGTPSILIAPNHYHHLGLSEFVSRYPNVVVTASELATARLQKQAPDIHFEPLHTLEAVTGDSVHLLVPDGTKGGEIWLRITRDNHHLWVVGDAWFNLKSHLPGIFGAVCRILRVSSGLRASRSWFWFQVARRRSYIDWTVGALANHPPTGLICLHGEPLMGPKVADRLTATLSG